MARELTASQAVFDLVVHMFPLDFLPNDITAASPPANLSEALELLQFMEWEEASAISDVMLPALESHGYFDYIRQDLHSLIGRLIWQKGALSLGFLNAEAMKKLLHHYTVVLPSHIDTCERHRRNAVANDQLYRLRFPLPIFGRLKRMHRDYELLLLTIVNKETELVAGCIEGLRPILVTSASGSGDA